MNPNYKEPVSHEEFNELRDFIANGNKNFSKEILKSAEYLHSLNEKKVGIPPINVSVADYIFKCDICTELNLPGWYQIILATVGGTIMDKKNSKLEDLSKGFSGDNISKIKKNDKEEYQISSLNHVKNYGYVCDHCRDSCFDKEGNPLS